jgi:hypothetical protein
MPGWDAVQRSRRLQRAQDQRDRESRRYYELLRLRRLVAETSADVEQALGDLRNGKGDPLAMLEQVAAALREGVNGNGA